MFFKKINYYHMNSIEFGFFFLFSLALTAIFVWDKPAEQSSFFRKTYENWIKYQHNKEFKTSEKVKYYEVKSPFVFGQKKKDKTKNRKERERTKKQQHSEKKLTISEIKKNYRFSLIEKIIKFDNVHVIIESHKATMANQFDYYDMITGEKKKLPTFPFYARLHKIESPYRFIFYADGTNHLNQERKFPFIIECYRNIKGKEFHWNHLNRYFPIIEKIEFGGKKSKAVLKDLKVTLNGLEASFGPMKGHEEEFFAGYTDIPYTKTYGNPKKDQFFIMFGETQFDENLKAKIKESNFENLYIRSVILKKHESGCMVIINLKDQAEYYTAKKDWLSPSKNIPFVHIFFITEQDYKDYLLIKL